MHLISLYSKSCATHLGGPWGLWPVTQQPGRGAKRCLGSGGILLGVFKIEQARKSSEDAMALQWRSLYPINSRNYRNTKHVYGSSQGKGSTKKIGKSVAFCHTRGVVKNPYYFFGTALKVARGAQILGKRRRISMNKKKYNFGNGTKCNICFTPLWTYFQKNKFG